MKKPIVNRKMIVGLSIIIILFLMTSLACNSSMMTASGNNITRVARGSIAAEVSIRGKLEIPRESESRLTFGTPGTIKKIFVIPGSQVKAGKLLAKIDDTAQKLAVTQAQYNVEIALNELAERIYSTILGYPNVYPPVSTILRLEQAQDEVTQVRATMSISNYKGAMNSLRLALQDLKACRELLLPPPTVNLQDYPDIMRAILLLEDDIRMLEQDEGPQGVQALLEKGYYQSAEIVLGLADQKIEYTHSIVNHIVGIVRSFSQSYPDTATAIDTLQQVTDSLQDALKSLDKDNYSAAEVAKTLRLAQHYVDISNTILDQNDLTFKHGLSLKQLRLNNINLQKAEAFLESAKVELMKTEILAPFDGLVVDVMARENDQLSAVDYASRIIVQLINTSSIIELNGTVDEIDVRKIMGSEGKTINDITLDVAPGQKMSGTIVFISPYGSVQNGSAYYPIKINLQPSVKGLQRGLPATVNIEVAKHENTLLVPGNAVNGTPGKYWVDVVKDLKNNEIERKHVKTGLQDDAFTEIIEGLSEGEMILTPAFRK
jgi:RND family efflux transporter MFP subunit